MLRTSCGRTVQPLMHRQAMLFVNGYGTRELHARPHTHGPICVYTRASELARIASRNLPQPEFVRSGLEHAGVCVCVCVELIGCGGANRATGLLTVTSGVAFCIVHMCRMCEVSNFNRVREIGSRCSTTRVNSNRLRSETLT